MSDELLTKETNSKHIIRNLNAQAAKAHVRAWEASNLSTIAYCLEHNLAESTFYSWRHRYGKNQPNQFTKVKCKQSTVKIHDSTNQQSSSANHVNIKITLPSDVIVELPSTLPDAIIIDLIKELK